MDQAFYEKVISALDEGVYFVNRKRQVLYWSEAAERLSGYKAEEVIGRSCADNTLNHVDDDGTHLCRKGCPLAASMRDGEPREVDVYMHHKDGHRIPVHIRSVPVRGENDRIVGSIEIFSDNSEHAATANEVEALRQKVLTDPLSGIGNRRRADVALAKMEAELQANDTPFGVIFLDIDNFKQINDVWGHTVGDRVIVTVANTLSANLKPSDVACRLGGDEFVILVPDATHSELQTIGRCLVNLIRESWIDLGDEVIRYTASIGGALSRKGELACTVIERADEQLYLSKDEGRDCFHLNGLKCAAPQAA